MILTIIRTVFAAYGVALSFLMGRDFLRNREKDMTGLQYGVFYGVGFVANFFDVLGIGSLAPTLATYKLTKTVKDDLIPGTLVIGCAIPVLLEAFLFISAVEVETITLLVFYATGIAGAVIGGTVAGKLPVKVLRITMGCGLLVAATLMFLSKMGLYPLGGDLIGLTGGKLIIAAVASFILGALLTVGIGNYAPTMCLVYLLGMSPAVAFPIMMGLGFLGVANGSFPYYRSGRFHHHATFAFTAAGILGVLVAFYIVKSLPLGALQWLVIAVAVYTGISMLIQAFSKPKETAAA